MNAVICLSPQAITQEGFYYLEILIIVVNFVNVL